MDKTTSVVVHSSSSQQARSLHIAWKPISSDLCANICNLLLDKSIDDPIRVLYLVDNQLGPTLAAQILNAAESTSCGEIIIRFNDIGKEGCDGMANVINMNPKLLCVDVQGNNLGAPDVRKLLKSIATSTTVTHLNLGSNEIGPDGAVLVRKALERNTYITHLNLSMNELGPSGAASIAELLAIPTCTVQTLLLYGNYFGDDGARALCEAMKANKEVKRLTLGNNNITDNCATAIAALLEVNSTLEELDLRLNAFTVGGVKRLCKNGLEQNTTLRSLSLSGNPLGPVGADELSKSLAAHRTSGLTSLDISSCSIGPTGGMRIAVLIKTSNTLQEINLADNLLDDEAAIAIANNLTVGLSVTHIDLSSNAINDEGATFLLDAANENTRIASMMLQGNRLNRVLQKKVDTLLEERMVRKRFQKRGKADEDDG